MPDTVPPLQLGVERRGRQPGQRSARVEAADAAESIDPAGRRCRVVTGWAATPDDCQVAATADDASVAIWDLESGQQVVPTGSHGAPEDAFPGPIAVSPDWSCDRPHRDLTYMATCDPDGPATIWETATGREVRLLVGHRAGVNDVAISPDGTTVATGSRDGTVPRRDTPAS